MDDGLVKVLIEEGRALKDEINQTRNDLQQIRLINKELLTLLKGNGHTGYLKRIELLEAKTIWKNPITYLSIVGFAAIVFKFITG